MFSLQPLSDQAVLAYCADEAAALEFAAAVRQSEPAWLVDVVQAYTSVAVLFEMLSRLGVIDLIEIEKDSDAGVGLDHIHEPGGLGLAHRGRKLERRRLVGAISQ